MISILVKRLGVNVQDGNQRSIPKGEEKFVICLLSLAIG